MKEKEKMKKLMVMASAVVLAAVSQAAVVTWGTGNFSWQNASGANPASGSTVYLINGDTSLDTIAAAINKDTGAFDTSVAWYYTNAKTTNTKGYIKNYEINDTSKLTAGEFYNFSALVIDKAADGTWQYMVSDTFEQKAYNAGETPLIAQFGSDKFGANAQTASLPGAASTGWANVAASPEPTSAMLLLLGMAGLALRRRRA